MISINPLKLNKCDCFLLSWFFYYLQGIAYPKGSIISVSLLVINLFVSVVCACRVIRMQRIPIYLRSLNILLIMFSIYGVIYMLINPSSIHYSLSGKDIQTFNYIKAIYLSLLPIYAFYYYSIKGYLTAERLKKWGFVFILSAVLSYFDLQNTRMENLGKDEITNNMGYLFLSCFPLLVLYKKKPILQFFLMAFVMMFIVAGMKRGAIAIGAIVNTYFLVQTIRNTKGKQKFFFILLSILFCFVAVSLFIHMMSTSEYLMKRIEDTMEGNSSHRDDLYSYFFNYFINDASFFNFIFGRGANGSLEIYYNFAHNDWLEIAVGQGIVGIFVYCKYWNSFYKTFKYATNIDAKTIISLTIMIYFAKSLISMSYTGMSYICTSVIGYALSSMYDTNE